MSGNLSTCNKSMLQYKKWKRGIKMSKAKICKKCNQNRKTDDITDSGYSGWILNQNIDVCPFCQGDLENLSLETEELFQLLDISRSATFFDAMAELKEKDPIEFQLKMSQFRNQINQQKVVEQKNNNVPHCPTCGSTNIKKISTTSKVGSVAMWGILSRKVHKQWHCNNCKSEW